MSSTGLILPECPAAAYHHDYAPHVFYCDLPREHDGQHGHALSNGVWAYWDVTLGFASSPNPAAWSVIGTTEAP